MAREQYPDRNNAFYRRSYTTLISLILGAIVAIVLGIIFLLYLVSHRPLPSFSALATNGQHMSLTASDEPNLSQSTLLNWASKAAVAAYTFDFANYNKQADAVRPYFTDAGWQDYQNSLVDLIQTILKNKLFVNGVVSGTPIVTNQGPLSGRDFAWRVQIPFLVVYQGADNSTQQQFTVVITIVKVPTSKNPQGIGIDQFLMV